MLTETMILRSERKELLSFFSEKKLNGPHFKHGCRLPSNIHVNEGLLKDRIKTTRK